MSLLYRLTIVSHTCPNTVDCSFLPKERARIFISAAEPSGDRHAAALIHEIRNICPQSTFFGIAGPLMQNAGCQSIDDLTSRSAMLLGAIGLVGHAWRLLRKVRKLCKSGLADLVILVDSPALHLPMAKQAKADGCPVLYYIAPQLWAWAPWRIRKVRQRVDQLAAILPFEKSYFQNRGVPTQYVGHPLIEQLSEIKLSDKAVQSIRDMGKPVIACLPGSRSHVIKEVLPGQIEVARAIAKQYPEAVFLFAAANEQTINLIHEKLDKATIHSHMFLDRNAEVLSAADLALCASGTATLEVAYYQVPMVIMYNGSKWGYRLVGRWLIQTPHLSLINILANRRIVPEFMPYYTSVKPIAAEALDLLYNEKRRRQIQADLKNTIDSLGSEKAAQRTAQMALDILKKNQSS